MSLSSGWSSHYSLLIDTHAHTCPQVVQLVLYLAQFCTLYTRPHFLTALRNTCMLLRTRSSRLRLATEFWGTDLILQSGCFFPQTVTGLWDRRIASLAPDMLVFFWQCDCMIHTDIHVVLFWSWVCCRSSCLQERFEHLSLLVWVDARQPTRAHTHGQPGSRVYGQQPGDQLQI